MRLKKRLNNNVIVAVDERGDEKILMGCGLGFQKKEGSVVDESKVEKVFALADPGMNEKLKELLRDIPMEHAQLADDIVSYAKIHVNSKVSENVLIALCDHIYMAVERKKQGIDVKNVLLWDIKRYYRDEYGVGAYAVRRIYETFGVQLAEDEAGFIALHIVNAQLELPTKTVKEITELIQEIETIVRMTFNIRVDTESVYYFRFITHLKFFAERLFSGKEYAQSGDDGLARLIRAQYPEAHRCSLKIKEFIHGKYGCCLGDEEALYLCIHIARMVQVSK